MKTIEDVLLISNNNTLVITDKIKVIASIHGSDDNVEIISIYKCLNKYIINKELNQDNLLEFFNVMKDIISTRMKKYFETYNFRPEEVDPIKVYFWFAYILYEYGFLHDLNLLNHFVESFEQLNYTSENEPETQLLRKMIDISKVDIYTFKNVYGEQGFASYSIFKLVYLNIYNKNNN